MNAQWAIPLCTLLRVARYLRRIYESVSIKIYIERWTDAYFDVFRRMLPAQINENFPHELIYIWMKSVRSIHEHDDSMIKYMVMYACGVCSEHLGLHKHIAQPSMGGW